MDPITQLIEHFSKFPGIGPRQAKRFVYFLLAKDPVFREDFSLALIRLSEEISQCNSCFRYFQTIHEKDTNCPICADTSRDSSKLLVVEKDVDFESIHKMGIWDGLYFILGGSLPILEKEPTKKIRSKELFYTVQDRAKNGTLKEIVLAMNATAEGENTATYLELILGPLAEKYGLKITALGRGLSSGTELEYSDSDTMRNAITNRR
jgi:recombination protein RecR